MDTIKEQVADLFNHHGNADIQIGQGFFRRSAGDLHIEQDGKNTRVMCYPEKGMACAIEFNSKGDVLRTCYGGFKVDEGKPHFWMKDRTIRGRDFVVDKVAKVLDQAYRFNGFPKKTR